MEEITYSRQVLEMVSSLFWLQHDSPDGIVERRVRKVSCCQTGNICKTCQDWIPCYKLKAIVNFGQRDDLIRVVLSGD